jgi:phage-related protein
VGIAARRNPLILFCFYKSTICHFTRLKKQGMKAPEHEIAIAMKRIQELLDEE